MQGYGEYTLSLNHYNHAFITEEYKAMKPGEHWREGALWLCRTELARYFPIPKETTKILVRVAEFGSPGAIYYEENMDGLIQVFIPDNRGGTFETLSVAPCVSNTLPECGWVTVEEA